MSPRPSAWALSATSAERSSSSIASWYRCMRVAPSRLLALIGEIGRTLNDGHPVPSRSSTSEEAEMADPTDWRELNRAWWDERVPIHLRSDLYDVDGFKA